MAMKSILDTNVLVHFILGDNKAQKKQAIEWFRQATAGEREIIVKPAVIAEAVYVLESFYKQSREDIASVMIPFLAMPVLTVEDRGPLLKLWKDYMAGLHFIDAYLISSARFEGADLLSFDKGVLARVKTS